MAGSFSADLTKFLQHTDGNIDKAVRMAVDLAAMGVVNETPVDTGRLRSNWQFGKTQAPAGTLESMDRDGGATLARIRTEAASLKAGGVCWIVNNLPYAGKIEYGYSQKNPRGMVRVTLAALPQALESIFRDPP